VAVVDFGDLVPLAGGWSGQTFLAEAAGERSVVRIYPPDRRDDAAPEIDAAVLRLVRGLVPVPDVLEVRRGGAAPDQPGLLVTSYLPGERGDLVLPALADTEAANLGARLGHLLADLAGMPTLRAGPFVDADLAIGDFGVPDGLPGFVAQLADALGWEADLLGRLEAVAADAQAQLDTVGRTCLVHSDLNPKNLLLDPTTLTVTGGPRLGVRALGLASFRSRQPAQVRPPNALCGCRAGLVVREAGNRPCGNSRTRPRRRPLGPG
jgi:aminoglycoside phosphotransferase (APT) family kinase protein